jgi:membrane-anchored protein YejM (alkaline phosphatase superfamily)
MVHASETCRPQTQVPIYLKLPKKASPSRNTEAMIASHVDLLPTLLEFLGKPMTSECDGVSLFTKANNDVILAGDNGGWDPYQFCVQTDGFKAWFQYKVDSRSISLESEIYLQKLTDANDQILSFKPGSLNGREFVKGHFKTALESLFPTIEL